VFAVPEATVGTPTFGVVSSLAGVGGNRVVQLALKYSFGWSPGDAFSKSRDPL
jgi:hypothetical protein